MLTEQNDDACYDSLAIIQCLASPRFQNMSWNKACTKNANEVYPYSSTDIKDNMFWHQHKKTAKEQVVIMFPSLQDHLLLSMCTSSYIKEQHL